MRRLVLCVAVVAFAGLVPAMGAPVQWRVEDGGNGHYYELVGNIVHYPDDVWSWQDAKLIAESRSWLGLQAHLATITTAAENQFILDAFFVSQRWPTWIGLTDSETYGGTESYNYGWPARQTQGWVWVTGEPVEYTNWHPDFETPANFYEDSDFVTIGSQWNDHAYWVDILSGTAGHAQFLAEYDVIPEPSTVIVWSLLGASGVGIGWWRRRRIGA